MITVEIANQQTERKIDADRLKRAVSLVLGEHAVRDATISLAVVDDRLIHELNRRYLDHDDPTDVLSFVLEQRADHLDGEIVVNAEMAAARAPLFGWDAGDELLLYVIHGALHLVAYDDQSDADAAKMRQAELVFLKRLGVEALSPETAGEATT